VTPAEFERKFEVLDMMLSAHSALRESFRRRSTVLTLTIIALSILGATLALQDDPSVEILSIDLESTQWLAILSGFVFFLSIAELVLDWRGCAWAHRDASVRLGSLKGEFRRAEVGPNGVKSGVDLEAMYDNTTAAIVEIPNSRFNRLKAKHHRKVAISKMISKSPGTPIVLLRWRLLREGIGARGTATQPSGGVLEEAPPGTVADGNEGSR
jgi:hypothetical protein